MLYFFTDRVPQFIIGLHKFSSGYAILALGYKFRGWQFETPGYTHTVGGRRVLSYAILFYFPDIQFNIRMKLCEVFKKHDVCI